MLKSPALEQSEDMLIDEIVKVMFQIMKNTINLTSKTC